MTSYDTEKLTEVLDQHLASLDPRIQTEWQCFSALPALEHLRRIWQ